MVSEKGRAESNVYTNVPTSAHLPTHQTNEYGYLELQLLEGGGVLAHVQGVEVVVTGLR